MGRGQAGVEMEHINGEGRNPDDRVLSDLSVRICHTEI